MENIITYKKTKSALVITVPIDLIAFAAANHPETPLIVHSKHQLAQHVLFELEHNLADSESAYVTNGFQELLDKAIESVAESGEECVDYKESNL